MDWKIASIPPQAECLVKNWKWNFLNPHIFKNFHTKLRFDEPPHFRKNCFVGFRPAVWFYGFISCEPHLRARRANLFVRSQKFAKSCLVGVEGIEPSTSVLSGQRSTTELHAQIIYCVYYFEKVLKPIIYRTLPSGSVLPGQIYLENNKVSAR